MFEKPLDPEEQDPNCYDFGVWCDENLDKNTEEFFEDSDNRELIFEFIQNTDQFEKYLEHKFEEYKTEHL